jgi:ABC-2 type transport system permease protein
MKASFAYRATVLTNLGTTAIFYAITIMVWRQVYTQKPDLAISSTQMYIYLLLAISVNYALSGMVVEFRIGNRIRTGLIATDLLKPVDFQISQGIQALSDGLFNGSLGIVILLLGFCVFKSQMFPSSLQALGLSILSFLLGLIVMYGIGFVFVQGAFYTYSGYGIFAARNALQGTFSGVFAPLIFFPPYLKTVTEWLPFRHTIYTPISIYMGWAKDNDAYSLILQQTAWAIGLLLLGRFLMRYALKQLEIQGG